MDEMTLYLGTLAAVGVGGLILIVLILTRGSGGGGKRKSQQLRNEPRAVAVPRVQVVLAEGEEGLIWVVNGRATRDLALITDPTERRAIEILLERIQAVQIPPLAVEPVGTTATHPLAPSWEGEPYGAQDESHDVGAGQGITNLPPSNLESRSPLKPQDAGQGMQGAGGRTSPETPVTSPDPLSYEDELTRPFLARLRDSLFGVDYDTKPSARAYSMRPSPIPKKGKTKEAERMDSGFGIPRFEELNTLVQQKVAALPDAPYTMIRVGGDGMIEIVVQGRVFGHIDDVPDDAVRGAIQEAVAIWNRQS
jgi:hypothetical protein